MLLNIAMWCYFHFLLFIIQFFFLGSTAYLFFASKELAQINLEYKCNFCILDSVSQSSQPMTQHQQFGILSDIFPSPLFLVILVGTSALQFEQCCPSGEALGRDLEDRFTHICHLLLCNFIKWTIFPSPILSCLNYLGHSIFTTPIYIS